MSRFSKKFILLFLILLLAAFLRLWQLGNIPPSPDWDETALGYNAYSIIQTGRDEYGKFLPVVLRSFDDYKPALYAYLTIPSVQIFGLNTFAVRLPSAIFGILSILAVFYFIQEIFGKYKYKDHLSLLVSFFLAISPWSIQFSRIGFEANIGDIINLFMVLFFLKGLKNPWLLLISAFFAGINIYSYQSEKVFTPLLALVLVIIYRSQLFKTPKKFIVSAVLIGIIIVTPMILYILQNRVALLRVTGTSIFTYQTVLLKNNITKLERDRVNNDSLGLILDNRRVVYGVTILSGYLSHFDPNWLFIHGDIQRHHAPGMGMLYLFEFPLILLGIYFLVFGNFDKKTKLLIFSWLLLTPIPASITTEVPHAVRTLNFLPTWQILSALGALELIRQGVKSNVGKLFIFCFLLFSVFNFSYYLNQYFVQLNYYDSKDWQFGYKEAVEKLELLKDRYKEIVISDNQPLDKSYMFFLFYLKYNPSEYQKIGEKGAGGYAAHHSFGNFVFRPINWKEDVLKKNILYIGSPNEIPKGAEIETIYNLDGTPAIRIAGT